MSDKIILVDKTTASFGILYLICYSIAIGKGHEGQKQEPARTSRFVLFRDISNGGYGGLKNELFQRNKDMDW